MLWSIFRANCVYFIATITNSYSFPFNKNEYKLQHGNSNMESSPSLNLPSTLHLQRTDTTDQDDKVTQ